VFAALCLALAGGAGDAHASARHQGASDEDSRIDAILERVDRSAEQVDRFRARVVETRELALLAEAEKMSGTLLVERPGRIRWEYETPTPRTYVLDDGQITGWLPEENRVEKLDMSHRANRIERILAIGQGAAGLEREFRISLGDEAHGIVDDADMLVLVPKSRRVRRRVAELHLWISRDHGLPKRVSYQTGEGDVVTLDMSEFVLNPDVSENAFELDVPESAEIVEGVSSLGFGGDGDDDRSGISKPKVER
jgi:outer membrane lipoprotein carrier protein